MDTTDITSAFAKELRKKQHTGEVSEATLTTSDRVLARITDGIYRQPSSALRELISNAYDADATEVVIQTDAPKFNEITVRDNGNGMNQEALSNLIHNIGGSIKRTVVDDGYGIVDKNDPTLSPVFKRKLIGKIGIGLFAVSQLTHHFQIITKRKGDNYRLIADVLLKTYTEDILTDLKNKGDKTSSKKFETGKAAVKTISDPNIEAHGTDIILLQLKKNSRDILRSREIWERILSPDNENEEEPVEEPVYHIGKIDLKDGTTIERDAKLPWDSSDNPNEKFEKLTKGIVDQTWVKSAKPKLENLLDNYLNTIWTLSLSVPLPYIEKHPFDISSADDIRAFQLSNEQKGQANELDLTSNKTIREIVDLKSGMHREHGFDVYFDNIQLNRPVRFQYLPQSQHAIKRPLIFVGKCAPDLSKIPEDVRGGNLAFEAYLFWNSKIVPVEHNGVLIRIHNASGAPFDETFLKYQISEQTRLTQITAEIFVREGLDAALNIDRESFNFAHPHYQFITKWLHRALRQFSNRHKAIGSEIRNQKRSEHVDSQKSRVSNIVERQWEKQNKDLEYIPEVELVPESKVDDERAKGKRAFAKEKVVPQRVLDVKGPEKSLREQKIQALVSVLEAYGILEDLSFEKQESLIHTIVDLFLGDE